jgi:hypothetical protein
LSAYFPELICVGAIGLMRALRTLPMPQDPSHRRRELAGECLALAKQSSDSKVRASLLAMAQKWHDRAEFGSYQDVWSKTFYHLASQTKIGQELRAHYKLPKKLPHRILTLLMTGRAAQPRTTGKAASTPPQLWRIKMRTQNLAAIIATVAALSIPTAQAQLDRPVAPLAPSQPSFPRDCPPGVGNNGPSSNETTGSRSLSDQLSQSNGVICPPAGIDPGISAPPIGGGRTPVIPPPGTPGGDPSIQPK